MPAARQLHVFDRKFYLKTAVASALVGAATELFMIKTGFYEKCVLAAALCAKTNRPCAHGLLVSVTDVCRGVVRAALRRVTVIEAERRVDVHTGAAPEFGKRAPNPWAHRT